MGKCTDSIPVLQFWNLSVPVPLPYLLLKIITYPFRLRTNVSFSTRTRSVPVPGFSKLTRTHTNVGWFYYVSVLRTRTRIKISRKLFKSEKQIYFRNRLSKTLNIAALIQREIGVLLGDKKNTQYESFCSAIHVWWLEVWDQVFHIYLIFFSVQSSNFKDMKKRHYFLSLKCHKDWRAILYRIFIIPYFLRRKTRTRTPLKKNRTCSVYAPKFKKNPSTFFLRTSFSENEVRKKNVEGFFFKVWCVNGTCTDLFCFRSTGTGFST